MTCGLLTSKARSDQGVVGSGPRLVDNNSEKETTGETDSFNALTEASKLSV